MREPERESGQPRLINSEKGMGAHVTRGGTAKRARNASAYGWSRLGRSLALPAGRRARGGLGAWGLFAGTRVVFGTDRNRVETGPVEKATRPRGGRPGRRD